MYQALIYATFIAHLLRSRSGKLWWYIFKNHPSKKDKLKEVIDFDDFAKIRKLLDDVPTPIDIDVVTLMPEGSSGEGSLEDIPLEELNITLHLYTLYYKEDQKGNPCEFVGTLVNELKKYQ